MKVVYLDCSDRFSDRLDTAEECNTGIPETYFKFLYWKEVKLIVVANACHVHQNIASAAHRFGALPEEASPDGAGSVIDGSIESWESLGFELVTEHVHRPAILAALNVRENEAK